MPGDELLVRRVYLPGIKRNLQRASKPILVPDDIVLSVKVRVPGETVEYIYISVSICHSC